MKSPTCLRVLVPLMLSVRASGQDSSNDFAKYAARLREAALLKAEPQVVMPSASRRLGGPAESPWKTRIVTTTFVIGDSSAWDPRWRVHYGGAEHEEATGRRGYLPASFIPRRNPFYVALPYNDLAGGANKPESKVVIPWFREIFTKEGQSVCRDRWLAVRNIDTGKICYAQWSDCDPFRSDHWQYVFGNDKPRPNANQNAGLNVSPAVRDHLGLSGTAVTEWKFVEIREVPAGPWSQYGDNNPFIRRKGIQSPSEHLDPANDAKPPPKTSPRPLHEQETP